MKIELANSGGVLNTVLRLNNDGAAYYKAISEKTDEVDLKKCLMNMANESSENATELIHEIGKSGFDSIGSATTSRSKIYQIKALLKTLLTQSNKSSWIKSFTPYEREIHNAYLSAIASNTISMAARQLLRNQQVALKALFAKIIELRDVTTLVQGN